MDTAGTFLGSQGLLDTRTKVGMGVAETAVQVETGLDMDVYCRYVPGYPRITGYWDKGVYEASWNCSTVGKPVLQ